MTLRVLVWLMPFGPFLRNQDLTHICRFCCSFQECLHFMSFPSMSMMDHESIFRLVFPPSFPPNSFPSPIYPSSVSLQKRADLPWISTKHSISGCSKSRRQGSCPRDAMLDWAGREAAWQVKQRKDGVKSRHERASDYKGYEVRYGTLIMKSSAYRTVLCLEY